MKILVVRTCILFTGTNFVSTFMVQLLILIFYINHSRSAWLKSAYMLNGINNNILCCFGGFCLKADLYLWLNKRLFENASLAVNLSTVPKRSEMKTECLASQVSKQSLECFSISLLFLKYFDANVLVLL